MRINLHKNARTTPAQRAFIQKASQTSISDLADKFGVSETTIRRWKKRKSVIDNPHTPKTIKTAMTREQEIVVVLLRICLHLGLDDLLQVVQRFVFPGCSRSSLNRLLKRYHISRLISFKEALSKEHSKTSSQKMVASLDDYRGTYFYYNRITVPQLPGTQGPFQVQTLLDNSFRYVYADINISVNQPSLSFIEQAILHFPLSVLGIIFTDPIAFFDSDMNMAESALDHVQLIRDYCRVQNLTPLHLETVPKQTTDRLKQEIKTIIQNHPQQINLHGFDNEKLLKSVWLYNTRLNLGSLKQNTPSQAIQDYYIHFPNSFRKKPNQSFGTSPSARGDE
ncbi:transcriptional regulator (Fis family protein) [Desulforapulum autotrophicum HRM2]|uniref:Transcriptional regulator (Fis family protein) n=1 Tax=Desulforapulum autotrophicum (strain ATCC 43914 / DSM 3382 / VKM B-1955 / HRM2) TaxID=177437 RepID=C0QDD9_DESAH|nr:transcriptional regulator (Fis family protein) [Desulforapulum autotrophicum]ACN15203.1 transcriptional regulator (Fis family protein) [Desulforapulum autotrophicum HRM2]